MTESEAYLQTAVTETFDESDVEQFAALSGDENPLHVDADYAKETFFGDRIVHGALVNSLISAALAKFNGLVVFVDNTVEFKKPVYYGDELTATATVKNIEGDLYTCDTAVVNEDGTTVVDGKATIQITDGPDE